MDVISYSTTALATIPATSKPCGSLVFVEAPVGSIRFDEAIAGTVDVVGQPVGTIIFRNDPAGVINVPFFPSDEELSGYVDSLGAFLTDSQGNVITW